MQARGELARNEALLKDARLDLDRYRKLVREQSVSQQQVQAQESLVGQYEGAVLSGRASVADAELQLAYSRITAPVSGRVGLRNVDVGNMIRASDSGGLVVITQMRPMNVIFTLVEKQIQDVIEAMRAGRPLPVEVWGQDNKELLASGELLTIDNQIDTATGTVRAKAVFSNADGRLFPNQFVNTRLKVKTLEDVLLIPSSAVQRNARGFFVHVVEKDGTTRGRDIATGYATDAKTVVLSGIAPGDVVVTDGVDRLRDGLRVTYEDGAKTDMNGEGASANRTPPL
jgi:multidrug efflux system membrane fusion protein